MEDPPPSLPPVGDAVEERVAREFLELFTDDVRRGLHRTLADYQARFPGHPSRIAAEHASLTATSQPSPIPTGSRRLGPYTLLSELGRGGQGVVYLAQDERFGRTVALKLLPPTSSAGLPARMQREVEALARLDHPGLCVIYEAGDIDDQAYVATRFVPGRTLDRHIAEAGEPSSATGERSGSGRRAQVLAKVALIEQVARALHAAHEAGILHRDVKPANIMIHAESGQPVLLDFGLARAEDSGVGSLTRTGDLLGTTPYLAPERLAGNGHRDRRSDVWSLGVTLYELLTGHRPFEASTVEGVLRRIETEEPTAPRRRNRAIPRDLAVVMATALEKRPDRRYATALALAEDLAAVGRGEPVRARPIGPLGRAARWSRRNPAPAALLVVLSIACLGALLAVDRMSSLAAAERDSRLGTQALLARSAFEQARLLAVASQHGRRWRILELVSRSAAALAAVAGKTDVEGLPSRREVRDEAVAALLQTDGRVVRQIQSSSFGSGGFSADGEALTVTWLSGDFQSYGVRTLDVSTGAELARLTHFDLVSTVTTAATSRGGRRLAVPARDLGRIGVWDTVAGERLFELEVPDALRPTSKADAWRLEFAPDGTRLAGVVGASSAAATTATGPAGLVVWDLQARKPVIALAFERHAHPWLSFSADGDALLAPAGVTDVQLVPLDGRGTPRTVSLPNSVHAAVLLTGRPRRLAAVCAPAEGESSELIVADLDGRALTRIALAFRPAAEAGLALDTTGRWLALGDEVGGLHVLDLVEARPRLELPGAHPRGVSDLRWLDDGRLATHADGGASRLWQLDLASELFTSVPGAPWRANVAQAAQASGGGPWAVVGPLDDTVVTLDDGRSVSVDAAKGRADVGFSIDGTRLGRWDELSATLWDLSSDPIQQLASITAGAGRIDGAASTQAGALRVVESDGGRVTLRDLPTDVVITPSRTEPAWLLLGPRGRRAFIAPQLGLQPGGALAHGALGWEDFSEGRTGLLSGIAPEDFREVHGVAFSPDGAWVAARLFMPSESDTAADNQVVLWSLPSGELVGRYDTAYRMRRQPPTFSPDGELLVFSETGGRLRLVTTHDAVEVLDFAATPRRSGPGDSTEGADLAQVRFADDGLLMTRDTEGAVRCWDLTELQRRLGALGVGWGSGPSPPTRH